MLTILVTDDHCFSGFDLDITSQCVLSDSLMLVIAHTMMMSSGVESLPLINSESPQLTWNLLRRWKPFYQAQKWYD